MCYVILTGGWGFSVGEYSYEDAKTYCEQLGATLVSIHSKEEQNFMEHYLLDREYSGIWIGAQREGNEDKYRWSDDHSELNYTNWAEGSPSNQKDLCAEFSTSDKLAGKWTEVDCKKKNPIACQRAPRMAINKVEEMLLELKQELEMTKSELKQNAQIPIGFTYVQLPGEKAPTEMWSSGVMQWKDVSVTYADVFFRVEGTNSATFGRTQEENAPRLSHVEYSDSECANRFSTEITPGKESDWIATGVHTSGQNKCENLRFTLSGGEVRPRNMAVRVWKRTG